MHSLWPPPACFYKDPAGGSEKTRKRARPPVIVLQELLSQFSYYSSADGSTINSRVKRLVQCGHHEVATGGLVLCFAQWLPAIGSSSDPP